VCVGLTVVAAGLVSVPQLVSMVLVVLLGSVFKVYAASPGISAAYGYVGAAVRRVRCGVGSSCVSVGLVFVAMSLGL